MSEFDYDKEKAAIEADYLRRLENLDCKASFANVDTFSRIHNRNVIFECETSGQVAELLKTYSATETENVVLHGSKEYKIDSPFRMSLHSRADDSPKVAIQYQHGQFRIIIKASAELVNTNIERYTRSEYGITEGIKAARWKSESLEFYGGNYVLIDVPTIEQIINSFMDREGRK